MASPFAELKRRNVLRTAALYLAGAWLLLQVADLVFEAFGAPPAAMRWLISLAAVGFPLVLLLSWVFDITPTGLEKTGPAEFL